MRDYISNKTVKYTSCPLCGQKTLKVWEWEEHLSAWGFSNYRSEYFREAKCIKCGYEE